MKKLLDSSKSYAGLLLGFCLLISVASPALAQADPPGRVARLNFTRGDVSFQPGGEEDWVWVSINRPLTIGDALWTESNSRAEMHVGSTAIRMGPETDLSFLNLDDDIVQVQLNSGTLNVNVRHLYRNEIFEVDTPNLAVLLLQPGDYRIDADPYGDFTVVTVNQGESQIIGGGESFFVDAGTQAQAEGTDRLYFSLYDLPPRDEFDRWASTRDQREDRSQAAHFVSREVVGYEDLDRNGSWRVDPKYGPLWLPSGLSPDWAPFRDGYWAWIDPWGWNWIDEADWGFATSHYGRWVRLGRANRIVWAWAPPRSLRPGAYEVTYSRRPVYCPATVTFLASPGEQRVAWFALAPGEVYVPAFRASVTYINQLNITNTNVQINYINTVVNTPPQQVRYANRVAGAVVAVPRTVFVAAGSVSRAAVTVSADVVVKTPVVRAAPFAPVKASVLADVAVKTKVSAPPPKPPAQFETRRVVAKTTPAPRRVSFARKQRTLDADPGKPVDTKTEQSLAVAAPAQAPVVKAPTPAAPPKAASAIPKNPRKEERRAIRKLREAPGSAESQAPPPPPPKAQQETATKDEVARQEAQKAREQQTAQQQADKTREDEAARRKAEMEKRRADQEAARQEAQKAREQHTAQQQADKAREDEAARRKAEMEKRRADQEAARQEAARKDEVARQEAQKTREQQTAQQQADKAREDEAARRKAEMEKRRADQEAARQEAARKDEVARQEAQKAREQQTAQQQADKTSQDEAARRQAEMEKRRAAREEARKERQEGSTQPAPKDEQTPQAPPTTEKQKAAAEGKAPVRVAESVQAEKLISQPKLEVPADAKGVKGTVVVRARIGADGHVKDARVLRGPKPLQGAALQNARQRVYRPTLVNGQPVEVETEISVTF